MHKKVKIEEALKLKKAIFIDVRSPHEYHEGTMANSINIPLLDNEERIEVGTLYKQVGAEAAKRRGLEIVGSKLLLIYDQLTTLSQKYDQLIVSCARGGLRSTTFVSFFRVLGINLLQLEGGFKAYRNYLLTYLKEVHLHHQFIVLHGFTGVGKTEILVGLDHRGVPILDLECLANNKGSVFGEALDYDERVTQKNFENQLIEKLVTTKERYLVVESESKRLGSVNIPAEIYHLITNGTHILVETSDEERISRLVDDYVNKPDNYEDLLIRGITNLKKRIGTEQVEKYLKWVEEKKFSLVAEGLIRNYYDPLYRHSIEKYNYDKKINYDRIEEAISKIAIYYEELEGKTD